MANFHKIKAKFSSKCRVCGKPINKEDWILIGPKNGYRRWVAYIECAEQRQKQKILEGIPKHLHQIIENYGLAGRGYTNPAKSPTSRQMKTLCSYTKSQIWRDLNLTHGEVLDIAGIKRQNGE